MNEKDKQALQEILTRNLNKLDAQRYYNRITLLSVQGGSKNGCIIKQTVAKHFGVTLEELDAESKNDRIAPIRAVAMYLCHEDTHYSLLDIAKHFNRKDHGTVSHAVKKVKANQDLLAVAKEIRAKYAT